jgi:hypothetical protein
MTVLAGPTRCWLASGSDARRVRSLQHRQRARTAADRSVGQPLRGFTRPEVSPEGRVILTSGRSRLAMLRSSPGLAGILNGQNHGFSACLAPARGPRLLARTRRSPRRGVRIGRSARKEPFLDVFPKPLASLAASIICTGRTVMKSFHLMSASRGVCTARDPRSCA